MQEEFIVDLNEFEVINTIGEGENGVVLLVENKTTKVQYTSKSNKITDKYSMTELKEMINKYSKAKYPTISNFIGYNLLDFNNNSNFTVITEYISNGSIENLMNKILSAQTPAEWTDTKRYLFLVGIALGMNNLHDQGIIHGDLKPSNILLDENYYPRIVDILQSHIIPPPSSATPYTAPEILTDNRFTTSSDVYSFGQIALEILMNKRSLIEISDDIIPDNQKFLYECLSKDPSERPAFHDICYKLSSESFLKLFQSIEYDEAIEFIEKFNETDGYAQLFHSLFLSRMNGEENKTKSIQILKNAADNGNDHAMLRFGDLMNSLEKHDDSIRYYKMAADKGNVDAMTTYFRNVEEELPTDAIRYLKAAADRGHKYGILKYATMLETGDGIPADVNEAVRYYKIGIERRIPKAIYRYACMLNKGDLIEANKEESVRLFKMAADLNDSNSMLQLAEIFKNGCDGIQANIDESIRYYLAAIKHQNTLAAKEYAEMLETGDGIPVDKKKALKYYLIGADGGNTDCMYKCGMLFGESDGVNYNLSEAHYYFGLAADSGHVDAMYQCAILYEMDSDLIEYAIQYYKMAADRGHLDSMLKCIKLTSGSEKIHYCMLAIEKGSASAMYSLATILEKGTDDAEADKEKAVEYYKMAADAGHVYSMCKYAYLIAYKDASNKEEAVKYFKMAIDKGSDDAMRCYADMLAHYKENIEDVIKYYKMAIDLGNKISMYKYALMLEEGRGVPANREEAMKYFKMAADKGDAASMYKYACMLDDDINNEEEDDDKEVSYQLTFEKGSRNELESYSIMISRDKETQEKKDEICNYLKMAIVKKNCDAMVKYASMVRRGDGTSLDKKKALELYNLASVNGNEDAENYYQQMRENGEGIPMYRNFLDSSEELSLDLLTNGS